MARRAPIKLLNEDGSFNSWIYESRMRDLLGSESATCRKTKGLVVLRLKPVAAASESKSSMCMPTLAEMKIYAERRNVPEEIRAKVEACRTVLNVVSMEIAFDAQDYLTDSEYGDTCDGTYFPMGSSFRSEASAAA